MNISLHLHKEKSTLLNAAYNFLLTAYLQFHNISELIIIIIIIILFIKSVIWNKILSSVQNVINVKYSINMHKMRIGCRSCKIMI